MDRPDPAVVDEARAAARRAAGAAGVDVRPLATLDEAREALGVMEATWGSTQLIGHELLRAFQASGNVLIGAYEGDRMVGFVLGFYGHDEEGFHHHSHMLAALPERRRRGVGYALKLAQRAAVLETGATVVRWTFDPLVAPNAHFNLAKLGALADRFHRHFYGEMEDVLNRGDRSDRLEVRWDLESWPPAVLIPLEEPFPVLRREGDEDLPLPSDVRRPEAKNAVVEIPRDYPALRQRDLSLAAAWRDAVAEALEACFSRGLVANSFLPGAAYLFGSHVWSVRVVGE